MDFFANLLSGFENPTGDFVRPPNSDPMRLLDAREFVTSHDLAALGVLHRAVDKGIWELLWYFVIV